jgi:enediyne biosynthesis protein CalE5
VGIWNRMSAIYLRGVDKRFDPVVSGVLRRAALRPGQRILDLGTGTGSVALRAASAVLPDGTVMAVDISPEMLALARHRASSLGLRNVTFQAGRAEEIPPASGAFDGVLASLSLMYVIDRPAAAYEIARVLRPGGRFVAAVWGGAEQADIVLFQQTAGSFAPMPPVPGVGPGALADPAGFLAQLEQAGLHGRVETETTSFSFEDFASTWEVLAGFTAAQLLPERLEEAQATVRAKMWPLGDGPRQFKNLTQFIVGERR